MATDVITPEFQLSYPSLFNVKPDKKGRYIYSITMVFDKDADLTPLKKALTGAKEKKFGKDYTGKLKMPFRLGNEENFDLNKNPHYAGKIIVSARSYDDPPGVVNRDLSPIMDKKDIYPGCWGIASLQAYGYDVENDQGRSRGLTFSLQHFMKTRDDKPWVTGRVSVEDAFSAVNLPDLPEDVYSGNDEFEDFA